MSAKKVVKKAVKAKPTTKSLSIKKAFSKSEIIKSIAEAAQLGKKQATIAMNWLSHIIKAHISKNGPGVFVFPGIAKFKVVSKPATKARKGKNPFTGEPMTFAAKPVRSAVKVKPLKNLKDSVK
ncbi:MAG: HU family DNA-binding protein [bacterium]